MLASRIRSLGKILPTALLKSKKFSVSSVRNSSGGHGHAHSDLPSGWEYRTNGKPGPYYRLGHYGYVLVWWWWLYHVFTQYQHLGIEFPLPEPSLWTDEELGIPPDDEE